MNEDFKKFIEPIRKGMLQSTDYIQLPDAPLIAQKKADYATYCQELRDMTEQNLPTMEEVVWPQEPGSN